MNIALMAKWIWRIFREENSSLLWLKLLRAKYRTAEFFSSSPTNCSPFWHSMHKVKDFFREGVKFAPGKNSSISFWRDLWIGDVPLCVRFPTLFAKSSDSDLTMAQAYSEDGWRIFFRRALDQGDSLAWAEMSELLEDIELDDVPTSISWNLTPSGQYTSKSLYLSLCKAPEVPLTKLIWNCQMPLKFKIFTWQLLKGRLPSSDHIHAWGGASDGNCALCGMPEDADHIFFQCYLAQFLWSGVREMFRVNWNPRSRLEWTNILHSLPAKPRRLLWTFFAAQCWSLWTTRNKFTIEGKFPRQPADCIFKIILSLQLWRQIQKPKDRELLDEMVALSKSFFANSYSPPSAPPTNHPATTSTTTTT
jgi:hypothetical protein